MERKDIQQIIRESFRQNFRLYPESYPLTDDGIMSEEGTICAQEVGKGYWAERNEDEVERDEKAGVTEIDYVKWVMAELSDLTPAAEATTFSTWAAEINKGWSAGYSATATDEGLAVAFEGKEVARIDYAAGRYKVSGEDKEATEQLEHMVNR